MLAELFTSENMVAFFTLTLLEIVLGIDNIVFIAILAGKLDEKVQKKATTTGLIAAMLMRIGMLFAISWVIKLDQNVLFSLFKHDFTGKDLVLLVGGLFLLGKATHEIHHKLEIPDEFEKEVKKQAATFTTVIVQIMMLDIIFSIDSVITAVGIAKNIWVMVAAVLVSVAVMMVFVNPICNFVKKHPTLKMLALAFLLLIGAMLFMEGLGSHINKNYIYFAMGFSLFVEMLNMRFRKKRKLVAINQKTTQDTSIE